jgi:hypothetical protein
MIARTIKAKLLVFTIFFVGIGTGILIANFYTTRVTGFPDNATAGDRAQRTQRAQRDIKKFYDYLDLDEAQREQMRKIGEETQREFQELRKETQPRSEEIQERSRAKIRAVLNDAQRAKYDEFRRNMDERRQKRNREREANKESNKNDHAPAAERGQRPN